MSAVTSALAERRARALAVFRERIGNANLGDTARRVRADRAEFSFPDGSAGLIHISSIKAGLGPGEFELFPAVMLCGGPVRAVLDTLDIPLGSAWDTNDFVLRATLKARPSQPDTYRFRLDTDVARQARRMMTAVERTFLPLLVSFTQDYSAAVEFALRDPGFVPAPFCTAVTLAVLAGNSRKIADIERAARQGGGFPDIRLLPDPAATVRQIQVAAGRLTA